MKVAVACPNRHTFRVDEGHLGRKTKCPKCDALFILQAITSGTIAAEMPRLANQAPPVMSKNTGRSSSERRVVEPSSGAGEGDANDTIRVCSITFRDNHDAEHNLLLPKSVGSMIPGTGILDGNVISLSRQRKAMSYAGEDTKFDLKRRFTNGKLFVECGEQSFESQLVDIPSSTISQASGLPSHGASESPGSTDAPALGKIEQAFLASFDTDDAKRRAEGAKRQDARRKQRTIDRMKNEPLPWFMWITVALLGIESVLLAGPFLVLLVWKRWIWVAEGLYALVCVVLLFQFFNLWFGPVRDQLETLAGGIFMFAMIANVFALFSLTAWTGKAEVPFFSVKSKG